MKPAIGNKNRNKIPRVKYCPLRENGFALVEVMIYSAILAIFIGISFVFISTILGNTDSLLERNEVVVNETFLERKIGWLFSRATSITVPAPNGFSTTTIRLEGDNTSVYPAVLTFGNNEIDLSLAGGSSSPVTNNRVRVLGFMANHYSSSQSSSTLKLSVTFQNRIYPNIVITSTLSYALPQ
jgi:hypothetical protein